LYLKLVPVLSGYSFGGLFPNGSSFFHSHTLLLSLARVIALGVPK